MWEFKFLGDTSSFAFAFILIAGVFMIGWASMFAQSKDPKKSFIARFVPALENARTKEKQLDIAKRISKAVKLVGVSMAISGIIGAFNVNVAMIVLGVLLVAMLAVGAKIMRGADTAETEEKETKKRRRLD